jgi:hypothetical protein
MEPWRSMNAHDGGMEDQNRALETCVPVFADSHTGCNYVLSAAGAGGSRVTVSSVIDHLSLMRLKPVSFTSTRRVIDPLPPDESMQDGA